jgi:hypothetical protein
MSNEKIKILEMVQEGKITVQEGMDLLKVLEESYFSGSSSSKFDSDLANRNRATTYEERFLRIRVAGDKTLKVNVNVPLSLIRTASKLITYAMSFVPAEKRSEIEQKGLDIEALDIEGLILLIEKSVDGKIVDVEVADPHEGNIKVEVYVE